MITEDDFLPAPMHPRMDPGVEQLVRGTARALTVTWGVTGVPYRFGDIHLRKVGFADIPYLVVPVNVPDKHLSAMVPVARQHAFAWLAERGVSDEHVRVSPNVSVGRRRKFTDQDGRSRFGEECEVRFELSKMLAGAVTWRGSYGTLDPTWKVAADA